MQGLFLIGILLFQTSATRPSNGIISGRITFADGTPAAATPVIIVTAAQGGQQPAGPANRFAYTNPSGEFRSQNVPPGRYYVRLGSLSEAPMFYPGVVTENAATPINVTTDANPEAINFVLPQSAAVRVMGLVTFPANQTTRQEAQRVLINGGNQLASPIAEDGTFEIPHVRPGRYVITVSLAPGIQPTPIVVGDRDLPGVELVVPRLTPVAGTVVLDSGNTTPRFNVAIEGTTYRTNVAVGPAGSFTAQLPSGEYFVRLIGLPAGYYLRSLGSDKMDLFVSRLRITATNSSVPVGIRLDLSPGVAISGRVAVAGDGSSNSIKSLMLTARAVDQVYEVPLDAEGSFKLDKVVPGAYFARVEMASNLAAPLVSLDIPNKDLRDLQIAVPPEREVFGTVTVDGYGPPPKFSLLLLRGADLAFAPGKTGELPSLSMNAMFAASRNLGGEGSQAVQISVNALPDGSFRMKLPEGDYRVAAIPGASGVPPAYFLRSLTYGSADLLKEFMTVSEKPSELQIGFGTMIPNPWVKVSGKVVGFDPAKGLLHVGLEGRATSTIEAPVNADGSFEFSTVLQGSTYIARLIPPNDAASAPAVNVADMDVSGVQIVVPPEKEIRIVASVEGDGAVPGFVMTFAGSGSTVSIIVRPERDGSFRAKVPADERRVKVTGFPLGYVVKAVNFASIDALKQPLKIGDDPSELRVAFGFQSAPWKFEGPNQRIGSGETSASGSERADGLFEFRNLCRCDRRFWFFKNSARYVRSVIDRRWLSGIVVTYVCRGFGYGFDQR